MGAVNILQIYREAPVLKSLFNKVKGLKACNFIKKRPQHRCFPAKFVKRLRTPFTEHLWWLLFGLIPDPLVTTKLIPKGTLGLLYTIISQLMADTTVLYVAAYLAIMLPDLLAYCRG